MLKKTDKVLPFLLQIFILIGMIDDKQVNKTNAKMKLKIRQCNKDYLKMVARKVLSEEMTLELRSE
jgi:hypothetical protein